MLVKGATGGVWGVLYDDPLLGLVFFKNVS